MSFEEKYDTTPEDLANELRSGGLTYSDFEENYDLSRKQAKSAVEELRATGRDITEQSIDQYGTKLYQITDEVDDQFRWINEDGDYQFAIISDTHLGSTGEQLDSLNKFYDRLEEEDIDVVFHAGDISDGTVKNNGRGVYRGHSNHLKPEAIGWDRLIDYVSENYPEREDIDTLFISGNHDHQLFKNTGIRFGKELEERRDDLHWLGDSYANVDLGEVDMDLVHPSGGAPYCYTGDTKVLTKNHGFVRHDEIPILVSQVGDIEVATFNLETQELEFQQPSKFVMMDADKMYHFTGQGIDQFVTHNHRMIVRENGDQHSEEGEWEIKRANEVVEEFRPQKFDIPRAAEWNSKERLDTFRLEAGHHNGKGFEADGDDFLRFLGWYIAEGYVKNTGRGRIHLSQKQGEQKEAVKAVQAVGLNGNTYRDKIKSTNKVLAEWLRENVGEGAENKKVPVKMKELPQNQLEILLDAMFKGDGSFDGEGKKTLYTTASERLADDVVELLIKTGKGAKKSERNREYEINGYEGETTTYEVVVSHTKKGKAPSVIKEPEEISNFNDKVYGLSVENTTLLTMRNGKTQFSGQTLGYRAQTWLRDKPDEEKADITVFGHLHQFLNAETEGSQVLYAGAWQGSTPFLERKGIKPKAGGWVIDMEVEDEDIRSWKTDRVMYPIENESEVTADEINDMLEKG